MARSSVRAIAPFSWHFGLDNIVHHPHTPCFYPNPTVLLALKEYRKIKSLLNCLRRGFQTDFFGLSLSLFASLVIALAQWIGCAYISLVDGIEEFPNTLYSGDKGRIGGDIDDFLYTSTGML